MAYKNKIEQRKFQREWARKNRKVALPRGCISRKELSEIRKFTAFESVTECVNEAKKYFTAKKLNRIAVAAIAIRSIQIQHGGDRRTPNWEKDKSTLIGFARSIGVNYKTLHRWIEIKQTVIDKLPKADMIDWTAANEAVRHSYKIKKPAIELYPRFSREKGKFRKGALVSRYLSYAATFISENGKAGFYEEDWNTIEAAFKLLKLDVNSHEKLLKAKRVKLKGAKATQVGSSLSLQ